MATTTAVLRAEPIPLPRRFLAMLPGIVPLDHRRIGGKSPGEIHSHLQQSPSSGDSQY